MLNIKNKKILKFKIKLVTIAVSLSLFPTIHSLSQTTIAMENIEIKNEQLTPNGKNLIFSNKKQNKKQYIYEFNKKTTPNENKIFDEKEQNFDRQKEINYAMNRIRDFIKIITTSLQHLDENSMKCELLVNTVIKNIEFAFKNLKKYISNTILSNKDFLQITKAAEITQEIYRIIDKDILPNIKNIDPNYNDKNDNIEIEKDLKINSIFDFINQCLTQIEKLYFQIRHLLYQNKIIIEVDKSINNIENLIDNSDNAPAAMPLSFKKITEDGLKNLEEITQRVTDARKEITSLSLEYERTEYLETKNKYTNDLYKQMQNKVVLNLKTYIQDIFTCATNVSIDFLKRIKTIFNSKKELFGELDDIQTQQNFINNLKIIEKDILKEMMYLVKNEIKHKTELIEKINKNTLDEGTIKNFCDIELKSIKEHLNQQDEKNEIYEEPQDVVEDMFAPSITSKNELNYLCSLTLIYRFLFDTYTFCYENFSKIINNSEDYIISDNKDYELRNIESQLSNILADKQSILNYSRHCLDLNLKEFNDEDMDNGLANKLDDLIFKPFECLKSEIKAILDIKELFKQNLDKKSLETIKNSYKELIQQVKTNQKMIYKFNDIVLQEIENLIHSKEKNPKDPALKNIIKAALYRKEQEKNKIEKEKNRIEKEKNKIEQEKNKIEKEKNKNTKKKKKKKNKENDTNIKNTNDINIQQTSEQNENNTNLQDPKSEEANINILYQKPNKSNINIKNQEPDKKIKSLAKIQYKAESITNSLNEIIKKYIDGINDEISDHFEISSNTCKHFEIMSNTCKTDSSYYSVIECFKKIKEKFSETIKKEFDSLVDLLKNYYKANEIKDFEKEDYYINLKNFKQNIDSYNRGLSECIKEIVNNKLDILNSALHKLFTFKKHASLSKDEKDILKKNTTILDSEKSCVNSAPIEQTRKILKNFESYMTKFVNSNNFKYVYSFLNIIQGDFYNGIRHFSKKDLNEIKK